MLRVTILWVQWSAYMDACAKSLAEDFGCQVTIVTKNPLDEAPYREDQFFCYPAKVVVCSSGDEKEVSDLMQLDTDVMVICSWHVKAFRRIARKMAGRAVRILCMDNQWYGTLRQWLGVFTAPFYVRPLYDAAFGAGERQVRFARKLGFGAELVHAGHYACDFAVFSKIYSQRKARPLSKSFLFIGRLAEVKGIETLFAAWRIFTLRCGEEWQLKLIGTGGRKAQTDDPAGVFYLGFVQPDDLPARMLEGDVFVLPSYWEPWGVVVHEAAATGMPIICSDACGAGDEFVQEGENGFVVKARDAEALAAAFERISAMTERELRGMGEKSFELAGRRTPKTWASTILEIAGLTI